MTVYLEESFEILIQVIVERSEVGVVEMSKGWNIGVKTIHSVASVLEEPSDFVVYMQAGLFFQFM